MRVLVPIRTSVQTFMRARLLVYPFLSLRAIRIKLLPCTGAALFAYDNREKERGEEAPGNSRSVHSTTSEEEVDSCIRRLPN